MIVAHGQPSDPGPAEADLARVAAAVAGCLPGWRVGSATLAAPEALGLALGRMAAPLVFPFFMADGWFTQVALPARLAAAGGAGLTILPAFGRMAAVQALTGVAARAAAVGRGWRPDETVLVLAAHGSGRSAGPAAAARDAQKAAAAGGFAEVRLGFIEETPGVAEVAANAGARALCLPLFVARWGHVVVDLPEALASAGFRGPCLAPIGVRREVPGIIADAVRGAVSGQGRQAGLPPG